MTPDAGWTATVRPLAMALLAAALSADAPPASAQSADHPGKAPYDRSCGVCHGSEGRGNVAPPLVPLEKSFDEILAIVREGRGEMPPVSANAVSDDALRLIVAYLDSVLNVTATGAQTRNPGGRRSIVETGARAASARRMGHMGRARTPLE
jgi:mono/diheme cytochrome c family protein